MVRVITIVVVLLSQLCWGALPNNTTVFEISSLASNSNGGCYITGSSGNDYTYPTSSPISYTDLVAATTTTISSVARPFIAADVGNCLRISSGSGWTTGVYYIVSQSAGVATVDRVIATMGSTGGTGILGGAFASIATAIAVMPQGSQAWVHADGTYTLASGISVNFTSGTTNRFPMISGYTTTRGDGGSATLLANTGMDMFTLANNGFLANITVQNFILDCNGTNSRPVRWSNAYAIARNIAAVDCLAGYTGTLPGICERCTITGNGSASFLGFYIDALFTCIDCAVLSNNATSATGFRFASGLCVRCVVGNLSGSGSVGFTLSSGSGQISVIDSVVSGVTGAGVVVNDSGSSAPTTVRNVIVSDVGTYCFSTPDAVTLYGGFYFNFNACWLDGGSSAYNQITAGPNDITLSADPFTNAATNDFSLNSTAGGGAALKGVGFPGVTSYGTGYLDVGALQSQAGAAGTPVSYGIAQ